MSLLPPVQTAESVLSAIPSDNHHYLLFLANHEERGRPWCRDCEAAEPIIAKRIQPNESNVIWVGSRDEWNTPDNPWRQVPFSVDRVPTILKVPAGSEDVVERVKNAPKVVEAQILEGSVLKAFLAS